ncbi:cytochrome P450 3A19-like [Uloborus diversus]|uniref:cytochrome P450 3A19-like n=1 Tax=Uloborus diversus TaxID=327109 RepID=UPI00240A7F05|nr:cytochrome P450 3A19-like [Uloborus diversus]
MMDTVKDDEDKKSQTVHEKEDLTENYGKEEDHEQVLKTFGDKKLSSVELVAQSILFLLAGYDTTASTLSFASYLLAINPDVQDKLFSEISDTLSSTSGELNYEALQSMKYLDCVISETLRLYPPATRLERTADEDYELGVMGITIPKGMLVTIPSIALHKDPKYFPDPEKFNPDRFSPQERGKRDIYVYMPFGSGPRNCVGMRFALLEVKVCLAFIVSYFRIKKCPETKVPLEFFPGQQLLQPKSIKVQMEFREDSIKAR